MVQWMGVINLTPDSFYEPSRVDSSDTAAIMERIRSMINAGASIIDLGAVSTRPGADPLPLEEEWERLKPVASSLANSYVLRGEASPIRISVDTTSSEIVRRVYDTVGPFIVNDISAGEDDHRMLATVAELGLTYIAMHKRGTPQIMDSLTDYPAGVVRELADYFRVFSRVAESAGVQDWILDPGLGFAKTEAQDWEILQRLEVLADLGHPVLVGAAEKRFTKSVPARVVGWFGSDAAAQARSECRIREWSCPSGTEIANTLAVAHGATILRVHSIPE